MHSRAARSASTWPSNSESSPHAATRIASSPTTSISPTTPPRKTAASRPDSPVKKSNPAPSRQPTSAPSPSCRPAREKMFASSRAGRAPSAVRMPISLRRRVTVIDISAWMPAADRSTTVPSTSWIATAIWRGSARARRYGLQSAPHSRDGSRRRLCRAGSASRDRPQPTGTRARQTSVVQPRVAPRGTRGSSQSAYRHRDRDLRDDQRGPRHAEPHPCAAAETSQVGVHPATGRLQSRYCLHQIGTGNAIERAGLR